MSFKRKCQGYLPARWGCRATACTASQNSSQTTGTRASMQLKKEVGLLCKEDAVLTSTFRRARTGTEVAVTSKRVCGGWSPACEELSRLLASQLLDGFDPSGPPKARHERGRDAESSVEVASRAGRPGSRGVRDCLGHHQHCCDRRSHRHRRRCRHAVE